MKAADLFLDYRFILALTHALLSVGASHGQTVRDRFGASYTMQDIRLPEAGSFRGSGGSCQVGIFNLIFENWGPVGFNDPVDGPQRQAAACQVFSDLSELIEAAPNPYPLPRPSAFVNVRINQTFLPVLNQVGRGTPLYNFITIPDGDANPFNDFTPQVLREGVLDGEAWRTINGGFDAWYASTQCFPDEGNFAHYHADIQIDFDQFTFHELPAAPPLGVLDLYTVIAHEAMHCLGFLSHTAEPSPGIFGSWWDPSAVFFSRYDLGLYPNSLPFINNHLLCTAWGGNYAASADLEDPCNVFFDGPTTSPLEVYAPLSFGGSSMEHLDATCPGATPYLMHPGNVAGQSRIPTQDEANVLCDIDYHVNDHHGDLWSGWVDTYASRLECGSRLAGVDDIFSDYGTLAPYVYKQGQLGPLLIDNFLDNDEDQMVGGGIPTEYTCLTIIRGGGVITNALSASFEYTPDPGFAGLAILRYEPLNSGSNRKGNLTYVFIEVWPPDICGIDPCNIVNGGDFELLPWEGQSMTCPPYANWREGDGNSPDLLGWNGSAWSSQSGGNYWNSCWPGGGSITVPPSHNGFPANGRYVAMYGGQSGYGREGIQFELCSPLVPGNSYVLDFWAFNGGAACNQSVEFHALPVRACYPWVGPTDLTGGTNTCNGTTFTSQSLIMPPVLSQTWQQYLVPFNYTGSANANWLIAVPSFTPPNHGGAAFLDDVKIHPVINLTATVTDACTGLANGSIDLHIVGGVGPYAFAWSNGSTNEDPDLLAAGAYSVTVTDAIGCTSTAAFQVNDPVPCGPPFTITKTVMPPNGTYAGAPVLYTIQVCNTSGVDQFNVDVSDVLPSNFSPITNPLPVAGLTLLAGACETYEIIGTFSVIGTYTNTATLEQTSSNTSISASVDIDVLEGCPLIVYGSGGCELGDPVAMCLGVHTQLANVTSITYYLAYPDFLVPPGPGVLAIGTDITAPATILPSISSATISLAGGLGWSPSPDYGYQVAQVTVTFSPAVSVVPPYQFFCLDFAIDPQGNGVPAGTNAVWNWASTTPPPGWNNQVNVVANGAPTNLWTQAYHVIFTDCDVPVMNADFTIEQVLCTGEVSVSGAETDPNAIHIWTWGDDRTTPTNGAPAYTYNYFSTITDNQGWPVNPPIGPAPPGTYTITHTVILNGAASSSTQQVTVAPCCAAGTVIPDGSLASVVGTVFSGTVDIQGQFIVDDDVLFMNCQVYMEPGAEIIVQNGWTLDIDNASFTACNGIMWKSITAEDGSTVRIRRSYMDDAESTVAALDGSTVWIDGTQFHNNRVAVGIPDVGGTYNNVACWVSNSTFYSQGAMPQPYQGQTTAVGSKGFAAVDVHNTTLDFTAGNNIIHTLSNGIVGHGSDMSVAGCQMLNIKPDAAYAYSGNGAGIYANGLNGWNTLRQVGFGMNGMPSFNGCRWGVYTEYMNVHSTDNRMLDMGTAYRVDRSGYKEVDILNNKVFTHFHGMELRANDGAAHILVQNNDITFGDAQCDLCRGYTAILVTEGNYVAPDSRILNNTIRFMNAPNSRFGIALTSADDWVVAENDVIMASNAFNLTGIQMTGCRRTEVSCNSVNSSDNTYPIDRQSAIRNVMGREPLISCNEMDQTANGILFNGVAYNTDVRGNQFHNHRWPLHLDATAIIDAQTLKGNLWDPNATTPVVGAWYEVSNWQALNYQFLYDPNMAGTWPPTWSPPSWFDITSGPTYDCADHHGEHYCSQFGEERCKDCIRELDEKIASDSLENDPYTDETKWMLTADLFKKLDDSPALLDSLPELDDFYTDLQGSTTAAFKAIADDQLALYDLDSTVVAQLQANQVQIAALLSLVKVGMEQLGDSTLTPAQRQGILVGLSGYRQSINSLSTWNASALQLASTTKVLSAEGVKTANADIATTALIEGNEKAVNEVYLATVGKDVDSFTTTQTDDLFAIANQCPMVGGNAVFKARSLYWLIDDSYDFDDLALCLQHGIIVKSMAQRPDNGISVVPNPASDEATLVLDRELDEPGSFVVYDAVGAEVMREVVPMEMPRIAFSTSSLAPAMYHYQVRGPSGVIGVGKLTIVR